MAARELTILGSTGSIGVSALKLVARFPEQFRVNALVAGDNVEKLAEQIRTFRPKIAAVRTREGLEQLKTLVGPSTETKLVEGVAGAEAAATFAKDDFVLSAIVGAAGLRPTLAAVRMGKTVGLANKETLVVAGALVTKAARESGATLLPVDSEHNAIFQAMAGAEKASVRRLVLTASGGPFFLNPEIDLSKVTPKEALNHPNWKMGPKITVDSATMMNKGLEVIEARWLFDFPPEKIDIIIHSQSIIHSMVEFVDGSILAQMGLPDMCGPIAYAMTYPERLENAVPPLNFTEMKSLTFHEPDHKRFPSVNIAREALEMGETHPAVLNGANEVTVQAFLDEKIGFTDIARLNREVLSSYRHAPGETLEHYLEADLWGRNRASERINQ